MTLALKSLISSIPTLSEAEFAELVEAVFTRMNGGSGVVPLDAGQWAEKLDHSLEQAKRGQRSDAGTLTARIRAMYDGTV